jgi:CBS domain containing-hemolysin-like protein
MTADLVAVTLCLLGSAFFSSSETALTSLPLTRLEAMRQSSGRLTRAGLDRWATAPQELLITILIGNNLVNVLASALATKISYRITGSGGLALVVGVMTLVILVVGEITPKTIAQQNAQWLAARVVPVLFLLDIALRPAVRVLGLLSKVLTRRRSVEVPVTEEDLLFMLRLAHRHAQLDRTARHMIESVLRFHRAVAREIMTPRPRVETLDVGLRLDDLRSAVAASANTRFPVVDGSPDNVVGVLHARRLLDLDPEADWSTVLAPPVFIPENRAVPDLLQDFQRHGQHLAVVLDEFGGLSGVVTLEDLLELVVGEIDDEFDQDRDDAVVVVEGGWLVPGHLTLRRLEGLLHRAVQIPPVVDSVGGLVAAELEGPLVPGRALTWDELRIEVAEADDGRATRLLVREIPPSVGGGRA